MASSVLIAPAITSRTSRSGEFYKAGPLEFRLRVPRTPQSVFNAWTIAEYIELWSNTEQNSDVRVQVDMRAGVLWLVAQKDDVTQYSVEGTYIDFESPRRLVLTWTFEAPGAQWDSLVEVRFDEANDGTVLKIVHSNFRHAEHREMQARWWKPRLERLKLLLS